MGAINKNRKPYVDKYNGKTFGTVTIIKQLPYKWFGWRYYMMHEGVCSNCGSVKEYLSHTLKNVRSCGCLRNERCVFKKRTEKGVSSSKLLYSAYKSRAKSKNLEFDISFEKFLEITKKDCFYCGNEPSNVYEEDRLNVAYIYNGIDRADNKKGYTIENSLPCCENCNYAKLDHTQEEFLEWSERVGINQSFKAMEEMFKYNCPV